MEEQAKFLQDYRQNAFAKLSDSFATEENDYPFVTQSRLTVSPYFSLFFENFYIKTRLAFDETLPC